MKASKEWLNFKEGKTGEEISEELMKRYVEDSGFDKMCKELNRCKQGIHESMKRYEHIVKKNHPEVWKAYKAEANVVKTRGTNKKCTEEWLNIKRRYSNKIDLARYLMSYYVKFGEFEEISKISGIKSNMIKSYAIYPYLKKTAEKYPEEVEKFELANIDGQSKKIVNKKLIEKSKEKLLAEKEEKILQRRNEPLHKFLKSMPKEIEELKFLDMLCTTNINVSVRKIKKIAREKHGIEVYRLDWETGNKVTIN